MVKLCRPGKWARRRAGFTLVELLVAISILAIVAVLGWRGLDSIVRARVALTSDLEQTRGMQLSFAQLQSDCEHIAITTNIGGRTTLAAEDGRLTLVRTVFADNQPSRLQVISYRIKDGVFERRESAATRDLIALDSLWRAALSDTEAAQPVALLPEVAAMTLRLWRNDASGWRAANAEAMPTTQVPGALVPRGLEISLQLRASQTSMVKVFMLGAV